MGYQPLHVTGNKTGLVQERQEMILPDDAYPQLENAYVWREQIRRKYALQTLGRLRRVFTDISLGNSAASQWSFNIYATVVPPIIPEPNAEIEPGSVIITIQAGPDIVFTDHGDGTLTSPTPGNSGTIIYITGDVVLTHTSAGTPTIISFNYFPGLPVMGLRLREQSSLNVEMTVAWDTVYAYRFQGIGWQEFLPGTIWTGTDAEFFWTTNYFVGTGNLKIFWATNYSVSPGDPIRYTNGQAGTNWVDFAPVINAAGEQLFQCLALLPFRGRLVAFNTSEGSVFPGSRFTNRIRWAAIGTPFDVVSAIVTTVNINAWRDDIRGQGGFLDIPTSEDIVSVGFVRDNLVIYCERSTWQLRYTGRSIAPFQIEKVNSELGAEGTFSTVQFDTSLVGVGDKGIVECDSFKSELIDIKIPDLVFNIQNANNGPERVHGIRDFINRLVYWTYPSTQGTASFPVPPGVKFPNRRLVYNYENDSWAIFTDSLTTLGTFQPPTNRRWLDIPIPWIKCNFPWVQQTLSLPAIIGGNQQGYVHYLDSLTTNDPSLFIQAITANVTTPTVITSPAHNLFTGAVIQISGIPPGTPFANLNRGINPITMLPYNSNNGIFSVILGNNLGANTANTFRLMIFDPITQAFTTPQLDPVPITPYIGGGEISIRDNFNVLSKKFNFLDKGQSIQLGYLDILMDMSAKQRNQGAITLKVYADYNIDSATNTLPQNSLPDGFFNQIVPTTPSPLNNIGGTKFWQRVVCPTRANFITLQYTLSNAQMVGIEQENDVEIDGQVLWLRPAGRMTQI